MNPSSQYPYPQGQLSPRDYSPSDPPHITLEQPPMSNPPSSAMQGYQSASTVPASLQPGGGLTGVRPTLPSSNNGPAVQPMHQSQDQWSTPSKPPSLNLAHTYSRSSPGMSPYDGSGGGYIAYSPIVPTGSSSQYMSPTETKYGVPGSQRTMPNTPLGLADIRPRADSSLSDGLPGYELANMQPGTSNYMAPWALYAFDWCKWRPQGSSAGKLAVGSYLEDGHNFVSAPQFRGLGFGLVC
jgi:DDB1- and CUL4-associated factor 7